MLLAAEPGTIGLIVVIAVVIMLMKRRVNPRTRRFVIGLLGALAGIAFVLYSALHARVERAVVFDQQEQRMAQQQARMQQEQARAVARVQEEAGRSMPHATLPLPPPTMQPLDPGLTAQVNSPAGTQSGNVRIEFALIDFAKPVCSIDVQYSPDRGNSWYPATEAEGGPGVSGLNSSQYAAHNFLWNSLADLGAVRNPNVEIRVQPVSGSGAGSPGTSSFFVVDNRKLASHSTRPIAAPRDSGAAKTSMIAALGNAFFHVWTGNKPPTTAAAAVTIAEKPDVPKPKAPVQHDLPTKPQRPDWVNAGRKMDGNVYLMTLHVGPYTTPLECERELPKALQQAMAEYEDLLLGNEQPASAYQLPGDALRALERQRWLETRPEEIGGIAQDMSTLHVQVGFDQAVQQQIRGMAERAFVDQRLKVSGLAIGGVLGFLALIWAVLGAVVKRPAACETQEAAVSAECKGRGLSRFVVGGLIAAAILLAILLINA